MFRDAMATISAEKLFEALHAAVDFDFWTLEAFRLQLTGVADGKGEWWNCIVIYNSVLGKILYIYTLSWLQNVSYTKFE